MRAYMSRVGIDVRLSMIKGVVDSYRECRAWEKPGDAVMPLIPPGKFNEEVECDLMSYKQHIVFHIIDRCIRWAAGQGIAECGSGLLSQLLDAARPSHGAVFRR
eukprot:4871656-Pyramimonas_sp.AAC.1